MSSDTSCQTIIAEIKETLVEMQHNTISGVYMEAGLTNRMGMKTGTLGRGVGSKVAEIIPYWDKLMTLVIKAEKLNNNSYKGD